LAAALPRALFIQLEAKPQEKDFLNSHLQLAVSISLLYAIYRIDSLIRRGLAKGKAPDVLEDGHLVELGEDFALEVLSDTELVVLPEHLEHDQDKQGWHSLITLLKSCPRLYQS